jgi:hypothetical protein
MDEVLPLGPGSHAMRAPGPASIPLPPVFASRSLVNAVHYTFHNYPGPHKGQQVDSRSPGSIQSILNGKVRKSLKFKPFDPTRLTLSLTGAQPQQQPFSVAALTQQQHTPQQNGLAPMMTAQATMPLSGVPTALASSALPFHAAFRNNQLMTMNYTAPPPPLPPGRSDEALLPKGARNSRSRTSSNASSTDTSIDESIRMPKVTTIFKPQHKMVHAPIAVRARPDDVVCDDFDTTAVAFQPVVITNR